MIELAEKATAFIAEESTPTTELREYETMERIILPPHKR